MSQTKRYVVLYGKKKKGVILAGSQDGALHSAFEMYGKHRKDRVRVYRYAEDLKTRNKSVF